VPNERILLIIAFFLASLALIKLMRARQSQLTGLLTQYVGRQKEWAQKRARAASMAVHAARSKENGPQRETAALAELLNTSLESASLDSTTATGTNGVTAS